MFDIVLGSILAFGSVFFCFLFFLGGSYIGMFCTVITLIVGIIFIGKSIFGDSSKSESKEEIESETCYGVLQYYTSDHSAQILLSFPSTNETKMIPYSFEEDENYAIGTCFVISYSDGTYDVEDLIAYGEVPEEIRGSLVVYPNPNVVQEEPKIYSSIEQNS